MKKILIYIYFGLAILLISSLLMWRCSNDFAEFGLNLFTELLGIVLTVFFVERLFALNKQKENRPILATAYTDIRLLTNRYISFFHELYKNTVNEPEPATLEELLKTENI